MRVARVAGCLALAIHSRIARFAERGNASKYSLAVGFSANSLAKSGGISNFSIASSAFHEPSCLAASIFTRPAGDISPASINLATRFLLCRDQPVPDLGGANHNIERSSSSLLGLLSTQPKHRASSTASSYSRRACPVAFLKLITQIPSHWV